VISNLPGSGEGLAHAVVITGAHGDAATATFNNPWGDKDQSFDLATLVQKINADQAVDKDYRFLEIIAVYNRPLD
jgi:Papain-like cysteine protease AvrRpt2